MEYRIWDGSNMTYSSVPQSMLCTELTDKKGQMIYEYDIVQDITGHLDKIIFMDGCFQMESLDGESFGLEDLREIHHHIEVVGNIFEHTYLGNTPLTS
jgi:hypothetical protein